MMLFSIVLILVALLGLLAYTNPKLDNYGQFISHSGLPGKREKKKTTWRERLVFCLAVSPLMTKQTVRKDYVFLALTIRPSGMNICGRSGF
jgi:hypothetical protein